MPGKRFTSSFRPPATVALSSLLMALMLAVAGPAHALTDNDKPQQTIKDKAADRLKDGDAGDDEEQLDDSKPSLPMPVNGDGISAFTLSVTTSARDSYFSMWSPGFFNQAPMVPSVTLSPNCGIVTFAIFAMVLLLLY